MHIAWTIRWAINVHDLTAAVTTPRVADAVAATGCTTCGPALVW